MEPLLAEGIEGAAGGEERVEERAGDEFGDVGKDDGCAQLAIAGDKKPDDHHGDHQLVDDPEGNAHETLQRARDGSGLKAERLIDRRRACGRTSRERGCLQLLMKVVRRNP